MEDDIMINIDTFVFELQAPVVFGPKHIAGSVLIGVMIAVLLLVLFVVLKSKKHSLNLKIITVFLLALELAKYTHSFVTDGSFPLHYIPMQLCSFSLYLMPLVSFGKGKLRTFFLPTAFAVGLLAGLIVLFYPVTVLGGEYGWLPFVPNIIPVISFVYHGTMVFFSLYLLFSQTYKPTVADFPKTYVSLLGFASLAMITNAIFGTDMMFLNTGAGNPFQFILLENGRFLYYVVMMALAAFLLMLPFLPSILANLFASKTKSSVPTKSKN
jgi:uncharacterized membrane protein YwaF